MTVYRAIISEHIDNIPRRAAGHGYRLLRLDESHTLIALSDHPLSDPSAGKDTIDQIINEIGVETVNDHPDEPEIAMQVSVSRNDPRINTAPYPNDVEFVGDRYVATDIRDNLVIWDEG